MRLSHPNDYGETFLGMNNITVDLCRFQQGLVTSNLMKIVSFGNCSNTQHPCPYTVIVIDSQFPSNLLLISWSCRALCFGIIAISLTILFFHQSFHPDIIRRKQHFSPEPHVENSLFTSSKSKWIVKHDHLVRTMMMDIFSCLFDEQWNKIFLPNHLYVLQRCCVVSVTAASSSRGA